ncbi:MAG: CBS domain-containing protein [Lentisphaeria bacterium]|nr:CBS domain-containing protein [Lentisphaeria bacterium]
MTLASILQKKPPHLRTVTIGPDQMVQEAIDVLCRYRIGALIVQDPSDRKVVGICSERDVLNSLCSGNPHDPGTTPVHAIMTPDVIVAEAGQGAARALRVMSGKHVRHLPVFDGSELVGVVTLGDLLRELYEEDEVRIHSLSDYQSGSHRGRAF